MSTTYEDTLDSIEHKKTLLGYQRLSICILIVAWIGMKIISFFFPEFFQYPYFKWGGWQSICKFWPLFTWALTTGILGSLKNSPIHPTLRNENLGLGLVTSVLAGIWEELGYRYVFICYAMISITCLNWFLGEGIGWIVFIGFFISFIKLCNSNNSAPAVFVAIISLILGLLLYIYGDQINIVYWFYDIVRSVASYATLEKMDSVLYRQSDLRFIFSAMLANAWFRDGHKYQGPFGIINSWYCGMILLYATVTYGLLTAIVIHAAYNIIIHTMTYVMSYVRD